MTEHDDYTEPGWYEEGLAEQNAEFAGESVKDYRDPADDQPAPQADAADDDPDGCYAEFIDGSWTYCGCADCNERETNDREADIEQHGEYPW